MFIARSSLKEAKLVDAGEASLGAYYAAEAGLEDGLARLAADHNIEVPTCAFGQSHTGDATKPCDSNDNANYNTNLNILDLAKSNPVSWPNRIRMARFGINGAEVNNATDTDLNQSVEGNAAKNGYSGLPKADPTGYYYDLKITSRTRQFGVWTKADDGSDDIGKPDNVLDSKYGLTDSQKQRYLIGPNGLNFTLDAADPSDVIHMNFYFTGDGNFAASDYLVVYDDTGSVVSTMRALDVANQLGRYTAISSISRRIKIISNDNINSYISLGISKNNNPVSFMADIARLQSIGYYGGVKRRLEADVNRNTGGLINLFDFAVFSGTDLSQPN